MQFQSYEEIKELGEGPDTPLRAGQKKEELGMDGRGQGDKAMEDRCKWAGLPVCMELARSGQLASHQ